MTGWIVVGSLAVGTFTFKAIGPLSLGGREPTPRAKGVIELLAPVLVTALIVLGTVTIGQRLVIDERVAGVGAALVLLLLRAPIWLTLAIAAATVAILRSI